MKKLLFLLVLLISYTSYSQKYYDETDYNNFVDYNKKIIDINYKEYNIKGVFEKLRGKNYNNYLVVKGDNNIHFVIELYTNQTFYGIDVLEGEYENVLKGFLKGRKYSKKISLLFSNLPSEKKMGDIKLISEFIRDNRIKKEKEKENENKKKEEFLEKFSESSIEGVYNIQILKSNNLDYSKINTLGKLYITKEGITIKTDIPTLDLVRSNYIFERSNIDENSFIGNISKGYGEILSLNINFSSEFKVGGFSIINGKNVRTTTFKVID
tara:strand:+ start:939 stop:1742 length:804 start_codon:yes stop_codon:yes gene_type:complete